MPEQSLLRQLINEKASELQIQNRNIDPKALLAALLFCESSMGQNTEPRVEPAYLPGGVYFDNELVQEAYQRYGQAAAASYGPWQILYITALELGFDGTPEELADPATNLEFVIKYLNQRAFKRGAHTLSQIADVYNSGFHLDRNIPVDYIRKCVRAYNGIAREWLEGQDV